PGLFNLVHRRWHRRTQNLLRKLNRFPSPRRKKRLKTSLRKLSLSLSKRRPLCRKWFLKWKAPFALRKSQKHNRRNSLASNPRKRSLNQSRKRSRYPRPFISPNQKVRPAHRTQTNREHPPVRAIKINPVIRATHRGLLMRRHCMAKPEAVVEETP